MVASSSFLCPVRDLPPGGVKGCVGNLFSLHDDENDIHANNADPTRNNTLLFRLLSTLCNTLMIISNKVFQAFCPAAILSYKVLALDDGAGSSRSARRRIAVGPQVILDSGASVHVTGDLGLLSAFTWIAARGGHAIRVASGDALAIRGFGDLILEGSFSLGRVLYVPGLAKNIVSVSRLIELDYAVSFTSTGCFVRDAGTGELVGQGRLVAGLFELDFLRIPLDRAPPPAP